MRRSDPVRRGTRPSGLEWNKWVCPLVRSTTRLASPGKSQATGSCCIDFLLVGAAVSRYLASRRGGARLIAADLQRRADMTKGWTFVLFLALVAPLAAANDSLVRFKGGIG